MKFIIVGLHGSGKQEVFDALEKRGMKCGRQFSNLDKVDPNIYNSTNYELYSTTDIHNIFENNAYIFLHSLEDSNNRSQYTFFEGLAFYEFDNNDVFIMSPDQVVDIPRNIDLKDVCFVWLDNTQSNRISRYNDELRTYNFNKREQIETKDIDTFIKNIYNNPVLYFTNEDPMRVACIVEACIKHPDLTDEFIKNFS